jgi:hypothetical protein
MAIALLTANANQLHHAVELCSTFRILLISLSISLQVIASAILIVERMTFKKEEYSKCHKYDKVFSLRL